ncbi:internal scaffolding protein [Microviridae sp.]|nr:internal scaffolding protein [Microviridae sp.]
MKTKIRTAYGEKTGVKFNTTGPSMTKQSFADETNINFIVAQYHKTGMLQHREETQGNYGEFTSIDYKDAMDIITSADQTFASLPSSTRNRFNNSVQEFLDFVNDPDSELEMRSMGMLEPERPVAPVIPEVTSEATEDTPSDGAA